MPRVEKPKKDYPKRWCTCWRYCKGGKRVCVQTWKTHTAKREEEVEESRKRGSPAKWMRPDPELTKTHTPAESTGSSFSGPQGPPGPQAISSSVASSSGNNIGNNTKQGDLVLNATANSSVATAAAPQAVKPTTATERAVKPSQSTSPATHSNTELERVQDHLKASTTTGKERPAAPVTSQASALIASTSSTSSTAVSIDASLPARGISEILRQSLRSPFTLPPSPPPAARYSGLERTKLQSFVDSYKRIQEECNILLRDYRVLSEAYNELYRVIHTMYTLHRVPMPATLGRAPPVTFVVEEPRLCDLIIAYADLRLRRTELQNLYGNFRAEYLRLVTIVAGLTIPQQVWAPSSASASGSSTASHGRLGTTH